MNAPRRSRALRWVGVSVAAVALYALLGYVVVPRVAKSQLEAKVPELLGRPTTVEEITFDPFLFTVGVKRFAITERSGAPFFSVEELFVDLTVLPLVTGELRFADIRIAAPRLAFALEAGGRLSFADLFEGTGSPKEEAPAEESKPPKVTIDHFQLAGGAVRFEDASKAERFQTEISPLDLELTDFSTAPAANSPYEIRARIAPSTTIEWSGALGLDPLRSSGRLAITGVELGSLRPYLRDVTQLVLTRGRLDVRGSYAFDASRGTTALTLSNGLVAIRDLAVGATGAEGSLLQFSELAVKGVALDLAKQDVRVDAVEWRGLDTKVTRTKNGRIDLAVLAGPPAVKTATAAKSATQVAPQTTPVAHAAEVKTSTAIAGAPTATPSATPAPWTVAVAMVRVSSAAVAFRDLVPATPGALRVRDLSVEVRDVKLPLAGALPLKVGLTLEERGRITLDGEVTPATGAITAAISADALPLAPLEPWVAESVAIGLDDGSVSTHGRLAIAGETITYAGDLAVDRLKVSDAAGAELAGFERLAIDRLSYASVPAETKLGTVRLTGARARVVVKADGTMNVSNLVKPPKKDAAPAKETPSKTVLERFVLERLSVDYTDRTLPTAFTTKVQLSGSMGPWASPVPVRSKVDLKGRLDLAPMSVTGTVRPNGRQSDVDLKITLAGWDLVATTPYSVKHVAYPIEKGKLSLSLGYRVADKKLEGTNQVLVDQLTLGEKVESPDATSLPVKLALAILTDRHGKIELDLPVSGDLDDPELSFGGIIWKTLLNVLEKVATSPFALIGALVGGGEELRAVTFDAGLATLAAPETEKLAKIAQALNERPALRLAISGGFDPTADTGALARAALRAEFVAELKKVSKTKAEPPFDPKAFEAWQRARYAALVGRPADALTLPEIESELLSRRTVSEEEKTALAAARGRVVQEHLQTAHQLPAERLFLAAPKLDLGRTEAVLGLE
ncbi:DUF748 domain-containing protein [Myxococcota bacterium]|nr:DUF748 domain-containing protein [Myxococcota bacterium]